jgi:thiamine biosynthesis lipoprotein
VETSSLSRINQKAGLEPVRVSASFLSLMESALYYAELSGGAFNPCIGPLVHLWAIGTETEQVPTQEEIDAVLPLLDWQGVRLDREASTVFLEKEGMALDLGGIVKGYAADRVYDLALGAGCKEALISIGASSVRVLGKRTGTGTWKIGVGDRVLALEGGQGLSTSGSAFRSFTRDGHTWHHLLSGRTGYPAETGISSLTVIAENALEADALSTAAFILGDEASRVLPGLRAFYVYTE